MGNVSGIEESKIEFLVLDIYDYIDRISQVLNQVDQIMLSSSDYFNCESGDKMRNHYKKIQDNHSTLKQNLMNCSQDLIKAKNHYLNLDSEMEKVTSQKISKIDIKGGDING